MGAWYIDQVIIPLNEHDDIVGEVTLRPSVVSAMTADRTYGPSIVSLDVLIQAGGVATLREASLRAAAALRNSGRSGAR